MINYSSSKVQPRFLSVGKHLVMLLSFVITDSFKKNAAGDAKESLPEWVDPTDQLMVTFGSKDGLITDRVNFGGYKKWDDLDAAIKAKGKITSNGKSYPIKESATGGYVLFQENNEWKRIPDEKRTKQAISRVDSLFAALHLPEGSSLEDLQAVVDSKVPVEITVVSKSYSKTGNEDDAVDTFSIGSFRKVAVEETTE